jgi:alanyl-tRNA synthetase
VSAKVNTIKEIRTAFLDYFQNNKHLIEKSASLLPGEDPTLLFTTAGMVPFKDFFSGIRKPPSPRIATVQKCFRTTDLENVGKTKRHLSFFEMLGNFSFADYFKKEAIEFAWEFVTSYLPFDKEQIWITIYLDDDEAYKLWHNHIGIPENRIVRLGKKDNFWGPAGSTGACGPCSELYLDRGEKFGQPGEEKAGDEGDRFMEFWNLVFNQFDLQDNGEYAPLKNTGIDTGAGLERLATLVQGVDSVFDTDELSRIRKAIEKEYNVEYSGENIDPVRVLTDHIRALSFTMADGIFPSNESRGYVLRRILRRALLFGRKLGQTQPMLYKVVPVVSDIYGYFYPELETSSHLISDYIKSEEQRFLQTLDVGYNKLNEIINEAKNGKYTNKIIPGKDVFVLYDTFGFPPEMTQEVAQSEGFDIDLTGFSSEMEKQRNRGKSAWKGDSVVLKKMETETTFTGYDNLEIKDVVVSELLVNNDLCNTIEAGKNDGIFYIVSNKTPCYAESGGQQGDKGFIQGKNFNCKILDTQKQGNTIYHICDNLEGKISVGDSIQIKVDQDRRDNLGRNHSATHLLNAALRKKLGAHIKQSGSLVSPEYFRFDFTHPNRLSDDDIREIEVLVNHAIKSGYDVNTKVLPKNEAEKTGAVMTFGEKYGDTVRVVKMDDFSVEFCGGTHVKNTSDIKLFLISKESSPGAGNRRIEAWSSERAYQEIRQLEASIQQLLAHEQDNIHNENKKDFEKIKDVFYGEVKKPEIEKFTITHWHSIKNLNLKINEIIMVNKKTLKKDKEGMEVDEAKLNHLIENQEIHGGKTLIAGLVEGNIPQMKSMIDYIRSGNPESVIVLASSDDSKWNIVIGTTQSYAETKQIDLSKSIKKFLLENSDMNGGGGGKRELVQASGSLILGNRGEFMHDLIHKVKETLTI